MSLPKVSVSLLNGQLGGVAATNDSLSGLVLAGVAVTDKIALNEPKQLFGVADLATLGITQANNKMAYDEVVAFYDRAGEGTELWITLYAEATLLATLCNKATESNVIMKMLDAAGGKIRLLGVNRTLPSGYTPVTTQGIDADVITAMANLSALAADYATANKPFRFLLPGLAWTGATDALIDLKLSTYNRGGIVLGADALYDTKGKAAVGFTLGRFAAIAVHRNIGRVKDGAQLTTAYFTDGSLASAKENLWNAIHDKGFIFFRSYLGKNGYFFNYDSAAVANTDDYNQLSTGRTIDKAHVIAYTTYVDELLDNVEIDADGKLAPEVCKYFESRIENAVNMLMDGEISSFAAYVNPAQNVLSLGKLTIKGTIIPKGTLKEIDFVLGLSNPALA